MQFKAFNKILIEEDQKIEQFSVGDVILGYQFRIRYPSYRGTFLSCIEKLDFLLDGEPVERKDVIFCLNGKEYLLDELKDQYTAYWFVLDYATIRVLRDEPLAPGKHSITVDILHRIPYTGYEGDYLRLACASTQELETA